MRNLLLVVALLVGCGPKDADGDGYLAEDGPRRVDCDDNNINVHPGADEIPYDGIDNDCNPETPDDDLDGDGFAAGPNADCDDSDPDVSPVGTESCDGVDNDCDGIVDNNAGELYYADADGDGFGDAREAASFCVKPDGYADNAHDCDDTDADISPDADEVCNNVDDDCNGVTDDEATDATVLFIDYDGDGYGSEDFTLPVCGDAPAGWVASSTDCDDTDPTAAPGGREVCDGVDNDCDGQIDEDGAAPTLWYLDADRDGLGDDSRSIEACAAPTPDYVATPGDCDDSDSTVGAC